MKFIVAGCGHQGAELALSLAQNQHEVVVIDMNARKFEQLGKHFKGKLIQGIAFDQKVLLEAEIKTVDGLAAVTSSDDANIVTALLARNIFHVPQVVARVNDPRQAEIYNRLGLQTSSPIRLATAQIMLMLTQREFDSVMHFGSGEVQLMHFEAPQSLVGRNLNSLSILGEISIVSVTRQNKAFLPTLGTIIQAGDILHIASTANAMPRLANLLEAN